MNKFEEEEKEATKMMKYIGWIVLIIFVVFLFFAERADASVISAQYLRNSDTISTTATGTAGIALNCDTLPSVIETVSIRGTGNGSQKFVGTMYFGNSVSDTQWFPSYTEVGGVTATRTFTFSPAITCSSGTGDIYLKGVSTTTTNRLGYFAGYSSNINADTFCTAGGGVDYVVGHGTCGNAWDWTYEITGSAYTPPSAPTSSSATSTSVDAGTAILTIGLPLLALLMMAMVYWIIVF